MPRKLTKMMNYISPTQSLMEKVGYTRKGECPCCNSSKETIDLAIKCRKREIDYKEKFLKEVSNRKLKGCKIEYANNLLRIRMSLDGTYY